MPGQGQSQPGRRQMSTGSDVAEAAELAAPVVALVKAVVELVGGPAKMRDILDAEYRATDIAMDALEQEKIAKETEP